MYKTILLIVIVLTATTMSVCRTSISQESKSPAQSVVSEVSSDSSVVIQSIPEEILTEYKAKYRASIVVIDKLIPEQVLLIGEKSVVKLLVFKGTIGETVIPLESIARIEKVELLDAGMVTVKITDKSGKEISFTLTPEDAEKVNSFLR